MSDTIDRTTINPTNSKEKQIANPLINYLHSFLNGNNGCYYKSEPKTVIDKHQFYVRVYGTPNKQLVPMGFTFQTIRMNSSTIYLSSMLSNGMQITVILNIQIQ